MKTAAVLHSRVELLLGHAGGVSAHGAAMMFLSYRAC